MKLSDTQLTILSAASQRDDHAVTLPERLRGGAVPKVVGPLLANGLLEEVNHTPDLPAYRTGPDGTRHALRITRAGLIAIGVEVDEDTAPEEAEPARGRRTKVAGKGAARGTAQPNQASASPAEPGPERTRTPRTGTKQELLISMLRRPEGTTIAEIMAATGWLSHTVRGAIAGALKKRLGLAVTSEPVEGRGRVYRLASGQEARS